MLILCTCIYYPQVAFDSVYFLAISRFDTMYSLPVSLVWSCAFFVWCCVFFAYISCLILYINRLKVVFDTVYSAFDAVFLLPIFRVWYSVSIADKWCWCCIFFVWCCVIIGCMSWFDAVCSLSTGHVWCNVFIAQL